MKCACAQVPGFVISRSLHSSLLRGAKGIIKYLQCLEAALVHLMYNLWHAFLAGKKEFAILESLGFVDVSRYHPAQGWNQCCHSCHKDSTPFVSWFHIHSVKALSNCFSLFLLSIYIMISSNSLWSNRSKNAFRETVYSRQEWIKVKWLCLLWEAEKEIRTKEETYF